MKLGLAALCAAVIFNPPQAVLAQAQAQASPAGPAQHRYVIADFKTEAGLVLPQAVVVYGTYGKLNPAKQRRAPMPARMPSSCAT